MIRKVLENAQKNWRAVKKTCKLIILMDILNVKINLKNLIKKGEKKKCQEPHASLSVWKSSENSSIMDSVRDGMRENVKDGLRDRVGGVLGG